MTSTLQRLAVTATLAAMAAVPASSAFASQQGRNTLLGGVAGAGAGALLSHGSVGGTLAGAAGGALIGNAVSNHHKHYGYRRGYGYNRGYHNHGYYRGH